MNFSLSNNGKRLCSVDVYIDTVPNQLVNIVSKGTKYYVAVKSKFNVKNCIEYAMLNPVKQLIDDLDKIQNVSAAYYEGTLKDCPKVKEYQVSDPLLTTDKYIMISFMRNMLMDIADRHKLRYNED